MGIVSLIMGTLRSRYRPVYPVLPTSRSALATNHRATLQRSDHLRTDPSRFSPSQKINHAPTVLPAAMAIAMLVRYPQLRSMRGARRAISIGIGRTSATRTAYANAMSRYSEGVWEGSVRVGSRSSRGGGVV